MQSSYNLILNVTCSNEKCGFLEKFCIFNFMDNINIYHKFDKYRWKPLTQLTFTECLLLVLMTLFVYLHVWELYKWSLTTKELLGRYECRSHFFYYDKSRNGKIYLFVNVIFFAIERGEFNWNHTVVWLKVESFKF